MDTLYKYFNMTIKGIVKGGPDTSKGVGVLQGDPLSPLLANIYLNEFDNYIKELKEEVGSGNPGSISEE